MNWYDAVIEIKRAQENNQLVLFVGAGVSANSEIPTWGELIKKIAVKIGYDRCDYCKCRKESCPEENCSFRDQYCQEEYLRIPEYFYQSAGPEEYFKFIKTALYSDNKSNAIDDEVFRIYPHHVITTNYDPLLENSDEQNSQKYSVVFEDKGLLSNASDKYILKMHGDLDHIETIVLRESDYTVYEQKHPLISTFIKALLVNHTFVFIGYSLNDYNLNLIIGWINYFRKLHQIDDGPQNFFITSHPTSSHEELRLKSEGINVIDLSAMPEVVLTESSIPADITHDSAKKLLVFLKSITEIQLLRRYATLTPIINESFSVLAVYSKISFHDLFASLAIGPYEMYGDELVVYDDASFNLIKLQCAENPLFQVTFAKTGITRVERFNSDDEGIDIPGDHLGPSEVQNYYLDNNYRNLFEFISNTDNVAERIFYYHILGINYESIDPLLQKEKEEIKSKDIVEILLHHTRQWLVESAAVVGVGETLKEVRRIFNTSSSKYLNATKFLYALVYSTEEHQQEMQKQLEKHEERYKYNPYTFISGHGHLNLLKIQAYAYDYYFFMLKNCIPIQYFTNSKEYLSYYIRAILCTYSPTSFSQQEDDNSFEQTHREPYTLNRIDLDIITKYCSSDSLKKWIKNYSVSELKIDEQCNIAILFENLSDSLTVFHNRHWGDELEILSIVAGLVSTSESVNTRLILACSTTITSLMDSKRILLEYFPAVYHLVSINRCVGESYAQQSLLQALVNPAVSETIIERYSYQYQHIIKDLSSFCTEELRKRIVDTTVAIEDSRKKSYAVFTFRSIIPPEEEEKLIGELVDSFSVNQLMDLVAEKHIGFEKVEESILQSLEASVSRREAQPGVRTFPDAVQNGIESLILLYLVGAQVDLSKISKYKRYSDHLSFALDPDNFDYSKVNLENYMWQNIMYSPKYKHYFVEHKGELLTDNLEKLLSSSAAPNDVRKVVYGLLLDDNELRGYGE